MDVTGDALTLFFGCVGGQSVDQVNVMNNWHQVPYDLEQKIYVRVMKGPWPRREVKASACPVIVDGDGDNRFHIQYGSHSLGYLADIGHPLTAQDVISVRCRP